MPNEDDDLIAHPERAQLDANIRRDLRRLDRMDEQIAEANTRADAAERRELIRDAGLAGHKSLPLLEPYLKEHASDGLTKEKVLELAATYGITPEGAGAGDGGAGGDAGAGADDAGKTEAELAAARRSADAGNGGQQQGQRDYMAEIRAARGDPVKLREVLANPPVNSGVVLLENVVN